MEERRPVASRYEAGTVVLATWCHELSRYWLWKKADEQSEGRGGTPVWLHVRVVSWPRNALPSIVC